MTLRDIHKYKGHEMGTREDGKIVISAYDREFPTMAAAHAWVDEHVKKEAKKSAAPFSVLDLVKGTDAHRSVFNLSKSEKPPAGYTPIPGGKKGGYRKRKGAGWDYWYPDGKGKQGSRPTPQVHESEKYIQQPDTPSAEKMRQVATYQDGEISGHIEATTMPGKGGPAMMVLALDVDSGHPLVKRTWLPNATEASARKWLESKLGPEDDKKETNPTKGAQYLDRFDFRLATKDYTDEDHTAASAEHTSLAEAHSKTAKTLDDAGKRGSRQHHAAADYHTKMAEAHKRHVAGGINEAMKPLRRMKDIAAQSAKRAKSSRHFIGTQKSDNPQSPISGGYHPSIMSQYGQEN